LGEGWSCLTRKRGKSGKRIPLLRIWKKQVKVAMKNLNVQLTKEKGRNTKEEDKELFGKRR